MRIRPLTDEDKLTITAMIARDLDHSAKGMTAEFFYPPRPEHISLCYEDHEGPVFYVRLDVEPPATVRMHIQFDSAPAMGQRTIFTLRWGFKELINEYLRGAGCERLVFDSINQSLREFCERIFHFKPVSGSADMELYLLPLANPTEQNQIRQ
jgi:hypothetical protein